MKSTLRTLSLSLVALALALGGCTAPEKEAPGTVTFQITVPDNTPADATVYVTGDQEPLGKWNGQGLLLSKQADGTYSGNTVLPPGSQFQWKVTRGSWDSVELGPNFENTDNRAYTVALHDNVAKATVARWRAPTLTGNIKYHRNVQSQFVKARDLIVYLPPDYDSNPSRRYPVLYMHDGQNLMDRLTTFAGNPEWGVDEAAERLITQGKIEPLIIVGIYNTDQRIPEYTQVPDPQYGGGKADDYGKFLKQELKPMIDSTYRTKPEAQYTGVAGSSLGGLVSMYFATTMSDTFTRIGVISPSVWWDNKDIVNRVNALQSKPVGMRIWEDIGTAEDSTTVGSAQVVSDAHDLRDALLAKGWVEGQDFHYLEVEGAHHNEAAWAARIDQILTFLYPAP